MRALNVEGKVYRLPNTLTPFQEAMYLHLINWKWGHITKETGYYTFRGKRIPYDAILPESVKKDFPAIYPAVVDALKQHHRKLPFKLHQHFNHMVSSQAANVNLFLPVLLSSYANQVLRQIKNDFGELAISQLDSGFQIEYWGPECDGRGLLGDHTKRFGTDSDIAIAYYDNTDQHELCLWLIEHKLTEKEFTECHGITSHGRRHIHDCNKSFTELVNNMNYCYYHEARSFRYWEITRDHQDFFHNHDEYSGCPFQGGMNQLWRNQLLGLAIEADTTLPYRRVYFSVVKHPENSCLDSTINKYRALTGNSDRFSAFTSLDVINGAAAVDDSKLHRWVHWYKGLYKL